MRCSDKLIANSSPLFEPQFAALSTFSMCAHTEREFGSNQEEKEQSHSHRMIWLTLNTTRTPKSLRQTTTHHLRVN